MNALLRERGSMRNAPYYARRGLLPMSDAAALMWGLLFSSIGLGFFIYGKQQKSVVPLVCGLLLMIYPYFVPKTLVLVMVGIFLMAIPYFFRR